jgi:hypothetical protein
MLANGARPGTVTSKKKKKLQANYCVERDTHAEDDCGNCATLSSTEDRRTESEDRSQELDLILSPIF